MPQPTTAETLSTIQHHDPHNVIGYVMHQGEVRDYRGKWLQLYRHSSEDTAGIYDQYVASYGQVEAIGLLSHEKGVWCADAVTNGKHTTQKYYSMYKARDAVYVLVWESLGVTPKDVQHG